MAKQAEEKRQRAPWPAGTQIQFFAAGVEPVAKGSMRAFVPKSWAEAAAKAGRSPRAVITDSAGAKLRAYENAVRHAARGEMDKRALPCALRQPFEVILGFILARGDGDFDKHGHLLGSARASPWIAPDIDKLERSTLDALKSLVWDDDSRVVRVVKEKRFATAETDIGTWIQIKVLPATVRQLLAQRQQQLLPTRTT